MGLQANVPVIRFLNAARRDTAWHELEFSKETCPMKRAIAVFTLVAGTVAGSLSASAAMMNMDGMKMMMQCRSDCNTQYMQCLGEANKTTSDPMMALEQTKMNFMMSSECGKAAMECKSSCQ